MNKHALQVRQICAGYDGSDVLHQITFDLKAGEVLAVVGPNGSGKSTLLKALTGLLTLRSGEVEIGGDPLTSLSAAERARRCAVQPQTEAPAFDYTVEQFVLLGSHPHRALLAPPRKSDWRATTKALAEADLISLAQRSVCSLSTGEWQRTLLARAVAQNAPILLLDEPVAHLDPGHRFSVHVLLRRLARDQNRAVLCVSHDLNLAAEFCDRLMILSEGKIRVLGPPEEALSEGVLQEVFHCPSLRVTSNPFTGRPGTVFAP